MRKGSPKMKVITEMSKARFVRGTVKKGIRVFAQTNIRPQKGKYLAFSILAGRKTGFRLTNIRLLEQKTETFIRLF